MKKLLVLAILTALSVTGYSQGTVSFKADNPFNTSAVVAANGHQNRLVYNTDNATPLSGTNYLAQLYWTTGAGQSTANMNAIDASARKFFATGINDGVWSGATKTFQGVTNGTVTLQVRVWDGVLSSSWTNAVNNNQVHGESAAFNYNVPTTSTDATAFYMEGLQSFTLVTPEPATIALGVLGAAGLLIVRRRK